MTAATTSAPLAARVTVSYSATGGTGTACSTTEDVGSAHTGLSNRNTILDFTRSGYTFRGWGTEPNATSATYYGSGSEAVGQTAATGDAITLYAVWSKLCYPGDNGDDGVIIDEEDIPLGILDLSNQFAYIIGYPDGTVRPGGNITRAEVKP